MWEDGKKEAVIKDLTSIMCTYQPPSVNEICPKNELQIVVVVVVVVAVKLRKGIQSWEKEGRWAVGGK